jgi:Fe-S-cluster-containing dehydrogenase component
VASARLCAPIFRYKLAMCRSTVRVLTDRDRAIPPYGARYFDFGDKYTEDTPEVQAYENSPSPEYGKEWTRDGEGSTVGNARKCQFCIHRLDVGMLPACVTTRIGEAT